jgi:predicted nucleic acid-binding protein
VIPQRYPIFNRLPSGVTLSIFQLYNSTTEIEVFMDIVVDTSVILGVILNEAHKPALVAHTRGANLIAPPTLHWEIGNAFSAMFKRQRMTIEQANAALETYQKIVIRFSPVDLAPALVLADMLDIYAYDAYMILCAQKHRCPLLSLDGGLKEAAKRVQVEILEV